MRESKGILLTLLCVVPLLAVAGCAGGDTPQDGIFVHISHAKDDAHAVCMGLKMATLMADDHDVLVYFDIKGVGVVLKDAEAIQHGPFASSKELLAQLKAKGAHLCVCPGCLEAAGKKPEDVMEGVVIAEKDVMFGFTKGRILSIDC